MQFVCITMRLSSITSALFVLLRQTKANLAVLHGCIFVIWLPITNKLIYWVYFASLQYTGWTVSFGPIKNQIPDTVCILAKKVLGWNICIIVVFFYAYQFFYKTSPTLLNPIKYLTREISFGTHLFWREMTYWSLNASSKIIKFFKLW